MSTSFTFSGSDTDEVFIWADGGLETKTENAHIFYQKWTAQSSAPHSEPSLFGAEALRKAYPKHSIVMTTDYRLHPLTFPGVHVEALDIPLVTKSSFLPLSRIQNPVPGQLRESITFGGFKVYWEGKEFIVYAVSYPLGLGLYNASYLLHEGPKEHAQSLLLTIGVWNEQVHNEVWVYDKYWMKDASLWADMQSANWNDIILKEEFKQTFKKDVFGFFSSEHIYRDLAIPWKRGIIMYGPPGNGKTISLKAVMKTADAKGYVPLYVKSFQSFLGEEFAMAEVFQKARQLAPCVIVLEDLDSLINDKNRSFFLNQVDGLQGNDGLLIMATTNHFDRLDPGLSSRPSRFDRKYLFDDPDQVERELYARYWQNKLKSNNSIAFPDSLVVEVAAMTDRFSFAYLKEAFVSTLVTLAGYEDDEKPAFAETLKSQIRALREQLDGKSESITRQSPEPGSRNICALLDTLSNSPSTPAYDYETSSDARKIRALLDSLSETFSRSPISAYGYTSTQDENSQRIRALMDVLSESLASSHVQRPGFGGLGVPPTRSPAQVRNKTAESADTNSRPREEKLD